MNSFLKGIVLVCVGTFLALSVGTIAYPQGAVTLVQLMIGGAAVSFTNPVATSTVPLSTAGSGITPIVSAANEASHVLKSAPGLLYGVYISNPSASGFLMVFNSTTVPGDGAVTPLECIPVSASNVAFVTFSPGPPENYSVGISAALSSTGCFTKTTSPTGFFHGYVQ